MNEVFLLKEIQLNNEIKTALLLDKEIESSYLLKQLKNRKLDAWIYSDGNIEKTKIEGISFYNNDPVIILPFSNCKSILNFTELKIEEAISFVQKILKMLLEIKKVEGVLPIIYLNNIFFIENKILLISSDFFEKLKEISSDSYNKIFTLINNPYLTDPQQQNSYVIAAILYKILTGHFPFKGKNQDEILTKIRHGILIKPNFINPFISLEISNFIFDFITNKKYLFYSINDWLIELKREDYKNINKIDTKIDPIFEKKIETKYKLAYFWDKNYKVILFSFFVTLFGGIILYYLIYNYLKPRLTKGFTPRQIVETYYNSFNTLNQLLMSDCVIGNATNKDLPTVINLALKNRQLQAYYSEDLNENFVISPIEWFRKGRPDIYPPYVLFGIANLKILELSDHINPVFLVEYEKYISTPNPKNRNLEKEIVRIFNIKEKVFLKIDKNDWVIYDIERIEEKELK